MSIRKINKRLEAFREETNLLALVTALVLLFLLARAKDWITPAFLLLLIAEAAYLTVVPETRFYQRRLSNRYYARVRRRYKKLRKQVLAQLPERMQERFDKLETKRNDISQQQAQDEALLRDIVWSLDYLLEVFLKACRLIVKKNTAFSRALEDVRKGSRPASHSSGQPASAASTTGQEAAPGEHPRKKSIPGFSSTGDWANADVNEIQAYYDRKIAYLQQTIAPGVSDEYQAQLKGIIEAYAQRRVNAENQARALTILHAQCQAIGVAFDVVGEDVVSGELEKARQYIEERMEQIEDGATKLEELPVATEMPVVETLVGIWEWIVEDNERKQLFVGLLAGAVVVSVFGFSVDSINKLLAWGPLNRLLGWGTHEPLTHQQGWELGALVWSIAFATWFYMTFPVPQSALLMRLIPFLILVVMGGLFVLNAAFVLILKNETGHVLSILSIGVVFLVIDLILAFRADERHKKEFWGSVFIADIPIVGGMAVLALYQIVHSRSVEEAEMHSFVSGAVSFQLIFSNVLFALIRGGVFKKIGAAS